MATFSKPATSVQWDTNAVNIAAPDASHISNGFIISEKPPAPWFNYQFYHYGQWLGWLNERLFDGGTSNELLFKAPDTGAGNTIVRGGTTDGTADQTAGSGILSGGASTGSGFSRAVLYAATAGGSGTTTRTPEEYFRADGAVGANYSIKPLLVGTTTLPGGAEAAIKAAGGQNTNFLLIESDTNDGWSIGSIFSDDSFRIAEYADGGIYTDRFTILPGGFVGINNVAPTVDLHIIGSNEMLRLDNGVGQLYAGVEALGPFIGSLSNQPFRISANMVSVIWAYPNGRIGIGTSSPSALVHAYGSGADGGAGLFQSSDSYNSVTVQGLNGPGINHSAFFRVYDGTYESYFALVSDNAVGGGNLGDLAILGNAGVERARFSRTTGYLGLGTDAPATRLDVNGVVTADYAQLDQVSPEPTSLVQMSRRHMKNAIAAWATVQSDGTIDNSWGFQIDAPGVVRLGVGSYRLYFANSISFTSNDNYGAMITPRLSGSTVVDATQGNNFVIVTLRDLAGVAKDANFNVAIIGYPA